MTSNPKIAPEPGRRFCAKGGGVGLVVGLDDVESWEIEVGETDEEVQYDY